MARRNCFALVFPLFLCCIIAAAAGVSAAEIDEGVWEGSAECADGKRHYRVSVEPGEQSLRAVVDFLDGPGGLPWARGIGSAYLDAYGAEFTIKYWIARPLKEPQWAWGFADSEDGQAITSQAFGDCQSLVMKRASREAATGGVSSAEQLPSLLVGAIGCQNSSWSSPISLALDGADDNQIEGTVTWSNGSKFTIFGEFDPETGSMVLIGDQWIEQKDTADGMLDFTGVLRDRGTRLIAQANWAQCGTIDVSVPGTGLEARIARPFVPRPIDEWSDASACVTLHEWASQAVPEIGGKSFYEDVTAGEYRPIAVGLFADSRFVPYFGKPFEELADQEKAHIVDLANYCVRLTAFTSLMRHTGASAFVDDFISGYRPELGMSAARFRLLQGRLAREIDELAAKAVSEADIADLEAWLADLDIRFAELWESDLAGARSVIEGKLDAAQGDLAARLESQIAGLPDDLSAFSHESAIRADIALLPESADAEREKLLSALNTRLGRVADAAILTMIEELSASDPTLKTFEAFRTRLNGVWPRLEPYIDRDGTGFLALKDFTRSLATSAFPEFEMQAKGLMALASSFEDREASYTVVVGSYQHTIPNADELAGELAQYSALVESIRPEPTRADMVATDGSPTNLGIKVALSEWLPSVWSGVFGLLPYDLSFVTQSIRVSATNKIGCTSAANGGFWCDFDIRLDGEFPFLDILSLMPASGRFVLQDCGCWELVEAGGGTVPSQDEQALWEQIEAEELERIEGWNDYYQDNLEMMWMMVE